MSMKSYLVKQNIDFGQTSKFLIRPGDILVYDSSNQNKVTIYRNGAIVKTLANQSFGGLSGLAKSGWISEIHMNDAPKSSVVPSKTAPRVNGKPVAGIQRGVGSQPTTSPAAKPQTPKKSIADSIV